MISVIQWFQSRRKGKQPEKQEKPELPKMPVKPIEPVEPEHPVKVGQRTTVWEGYWGGRGESGVRTVDMKVTGDTLTLWMKIADGSDWGGRHQLYLDKEEQMTFPIRDASLTRDELFSFVLLLCAACRETYLVPKKPDDLMFDGLSDKKVSVRSVSGENAE